jgi:hypothetical protein
MNRWLEAFSDIPDIKEPFHKMEFPNQDVTIYEGALYIKNSEEIEIYDKTKIFIKWNPIFKYSVAFNITSLEKLDSFLENKSCISIDGEQYFESRFSSFQDGEIQLSLNCFDIGSKPSSYKKVFFDLPNLGKFSGEMVKNETTLTSNRISVNTNNINLIIDLASEKSQIHSLLNNSRGYQVNARCQLLSKRSISFEKLQSEMFKINYFISFLFGRWTSVFSFEVPEANYRNYFTPHISPYIYPSDKFHDIHFHKDTLNTAYEIFSTYWNSESDRHFIKKIVEWYTEISILQVQFEIGVILGQTCLELMYNHLIKKQNHYLLGRDAEDIATENKMRLLLKHFDIDTKLPKNYKHFKAKYFKNIEYVDGPMIISKVRNEIVHGNLQSSYFNVEKHDLYLVYDLVIGYVELVLINLLKIDMELSNRLKVLKRPINK